MTEHMRTWAARLQVIHRSLIVAPSQADFYSALDIELPSLPSAL
jgi:hypothetical protein